MTYILGYEIETDEELQELLDEEQLTQISEFEDEELYDMIIENIEEYKMADIIYYMMDNDGKLKDTLEEIGIIEEFDGEMYIESDYVS